MQDGEITGLQFLGRLRPMQETVAGVIRQQLGRGERRLHVVAPPGSGKTVLGLYVWSELVKRPAVVLSPNSAIQSQWASRASQFCAVPAQAGAVSTDAHSPGSFTSLTYQSVTLPSRDTASVSDQALAFWREKLLAEGEAADLEEARFWIADLKRHNPDYWDERFRGYCKTVRDELSREGNALDYLHASARDTLVRLRDQGVGLVILDECHHLLGHWGRVLQDAHELLDGPVVLGLTATPPDTATRNPGDGRRYRAFFGEVDFEVPTPALVRDGFLAPYQDLVYFVTPSAEERRYIANTDQAFADVLVALSAVPAGGSRRTPLPDWVSDALGKRRVGAFEAPSWSQFERRDPAFAVAGPRFLQSIGRPLPPGVPAGTPGPGTGASLEVLVPVMDRYIRHHLRRLAGDAAAAALAAAAIRSLRVLGVQVTETGTQPCASPVSRVMAYSSSKVAALVPILRTELGHLGDGIRAVVVADYEKTSAVSADIQHLLDAEAGGAVAAFRCLLADVVTDALDPVLVTGSTVLVDDDLQPAFDAAARKWLAARGLEGIALVWAAHDGFMALSGQGQLWCPRVYVAMVTALFQAGVTRCLVGTRGLLGEGWDANRINVLVDLTTVTTSTSVNQLRGRSIRLDPDVPDKVANNWDVLCIAPEFQKGLDDYQRFCRKHETLYGVTDDSAIEKGVGHVHPAFTDMAPEGVEESVSWLNAEMIARSGGRALSRSQWKIGTPYDPAPVRALELKLANGGGGGSPPFSMVREAWNGATLTAAIGRAVLGALREMGRIKSGKLHAADRGDAYVRVFLKEASQEDMELFVVCMEQAMGPFADPRYVIPRTVLDIEPSWLSRMLPRVIGRYFDRKTERLAMWHAVPAVLASKKTIVDVYQRHWNTHVSPGEAVYAHRGKGEMILALARDSGQTPEATLRQKNVFL